MTMWPVIMVTLVLSATLVPSCSSDHGSFIPPRKVTVVTLDQGWDDETREEFHFTSQGSQVIRYEYFLSLEQADNERLFRDDRNIERLRYLPQRPSALNPDGLPIGMVKHIDPQTGVAWFGITCAMCHASQINYKGIGMQIDGSGTLGDYFGLIENLLEALRATTLLDEKFERFADAVLGPSHTEAEAIALRADLADQTEKLGQRYRLNRPPSPPGLGRADAFGSVYNLIMALALDQPSNAVPPDDPVSIPFLWTSAQLDLVQWNGAASNAGPIGPLARNVGEAIGAYGNLVIEPGERTGYPSTVDISNLGRLETLVERLLSPQWPEEYLPAIDRASAAAGEILYAQHCSGCHPVIDRTDTHLDIAVTMVPADEVGTDPGMATSAATRTGVTGELEGTREYIIGGELFGPTAFGTQFLDNAVVGALLNQPYETLEAAIEEYERIRKAQPFNPISYKARPLNGIWATAPYLHNGSVPNLYELLLPPAERSATFHLGSRELDPVKVGFVNRRAPHGFLFDTAVEGNSNSGHTYGTDLDEAERAQLLEYLKTL